MSGVSDVVHTFSEAFPVKYRDLVKFCDHPEELGLFLLRSGLLGDYSGPCALCSEGNVHLVKKQGTFSWKCGIRKCSKTISLRKGSIFERSHLDEGTVLCLIYCWLYDLPHSFVRMELQLSNHTVVDWYNLCRDVCADILMGDNEMIGGPGHFVEVNESKFGKLMLNKTPALKGCWILWGIDHETGETFIKTIQDRSPDILLPILVRNVHPDTIVISHCWEAYNSASKRLLEREGLHHSLHFVDPKNSKVLVESIEIQWQLLKRSVLPKTGTRREFLSSYFAMYCIRKRYLVDVKCPFKAFLELVKRVYPLHPLVHMPREDMYLSNAVVKPRRSKKRRVR